MSCDIDSDSFHVKRTAKMGTKERARQWARGYTTTKKGDRRKTVSSRRAYVNTSSAIIKQLEKIKVQIEKSQGIGLSDYERYGKGGKGSGGGTYLAVYSNTALMGINNLIHALSK